MIKMTQSMRWYGPNDAVRLSDILQAGCSEVVTALHQIPVGDIWPIDAINERKKLVEDAGMKWTVIESLPVHEDIKKRKGNYELYIENYKHSLRNVAACGLKVVTYNFMPILDWLRTNPFNKLPNGATNLRFVRSEFIACDLFLLKRPNSERDYSIEDIAKAEKIFTEMSQEEKDALFRNILLGLPGSEIPFTPEEVLKALEEYNHINDTILKDNLFSFLRSVVPVAEECGLQMAIHPDDPPYPVLGLPRIVSTEQDAADIINCIHSPANGLCFCTGSYGARPDNDLIKMLRRFGDNVHFLHLRNTKRDEEGNFEEAPHLEGDADMVGIVKEVLEIMDRRGVSIPMRPDHGHQMLDDLDKKAFAGYTAIGRLKGLAEIRGIEAALTYGR